jgi:nitrate reductase assembly molybdenum cofactor insertion protein NarJ
MDTLQTETTASQTPATHRLRARAAAYALLARVLGPDTSTLRDDEIVASVRLALDASGDAGASEALDCIDPSTRPSADQLAGRWVRWFDLGRVAPYEGSNVATTVGGITPRLADVAGFYRAFGLSVTRERPDHVVAQLEFLAVALLAEAEAIEAGDTDRASIAAHAIRAFLRDHIGVWIDAWAARVGAIDELAPWSPYVVATARLVRSEATSRNVIPLLDLPVLPADAGVAADDEATTNCDAGDI